MSKDTYIVREPVRGEVWTPAGCVPFDLEAGAAVAARTDDDRLILEHLQAAGLVELAPAKTTKKGA